MYLHITLLLILTWSCWIRTLRNYFLADDYGEVRYVHLLSRGQGQLLLNDLFGPYMHNVTICVYRPVMLLTKLFDYMAWGPHAFGFYLSNLVYYSGCVVLLYLLIRCIPGKQCTRGLAIAAFFSAALFALNPLHCESVSWMVGRVDIDCCFYYLLALILLLHCARETRYSLPAKILGLLSFAFALGIKEMAIGLPIVLTTALYFFPQSASDDQHARYVRFKDAIKRSWAAWAVLVSYLLVRFLALGTLLGGYRGSLGSDQAAAAISHWLDLDSWHRLVLPIHTVLLTSASHYCLLYKASIAALVIALVMLLLAGTVSKRWVAFLFIWALTAAAPIYKLWGLGPYLEGSRFVFFLTMPLSALLPVLIFTSSGESNDNTLGRFRKRLLIVSALFLGLLLLASWQICQRTNALWIHAGKEVEAVRQQAVDLARMLPGKTIILLGLPDDNLGAHEIINKYVFEAMMQPPFSPDIANHFLVFSRLRYEPSQYIDDNSFKTALSNPKNAGPYIWCRSQQKFKLVNLTKSTPPIHQEVQKLLPEQMIPQYLYHLGFTQGPTNDDTIKLSNIEAGEGFCIKGLHLNPMSTNYLEFEYRNNQGSGVIPCRVFWNMSQKLESSISPYDLSPATLDNSSTDTVFLPCSINKFKTVRIKLSAYWQWFSHPQVDSLSIVFGKFPDIELKNIRVH